MLPDYHTCLGRLNAYNQGGVYRDHLRALGRLRAVRVGFRAFWRRKTAIQTEGGSILDQGHLGRTACLLRTFLIDWGMGRTGVPPDGTIARLLEQVRPHYEDLSGVVLGAGQMKDHGPALEGLYEGLDGITNCGKGNTHRPGQSTITGKTKAMIAIWGQTPAFDSLTLNNFCIWTHQPPPAWLPDLNPLEEWYTPRQFAKMLIGLDGWVQQWPANNPGAPIGGIAALDSEIPPGRIIDKIYNWRFEWDPLSQYLELEEARNHHRLDFTFLQVQGILGFTPARLEQPAWWTDIRNELQTRQAKAHAKGHPGWEMTHPDMSAETVTFQLAWPPPRNV